MKDACNVLPYKENRSCKKRLRKRGYVYYLLHHIFYFFPLSLKDNCLEIYFRFNVAKLKVIKAGQWILAVTPQRTDSDDGEVVRRGRKNVMMEEAKKGRGAGRGMEQREGD